VIATTRYEVLGHIASGGMGEILLARRRGPAGFEKLVVLKRPHVRLPSGPQALALLEEARLLARINHPNVCQVLDLEQAGDELYLVLELLEGLSLWAILVAVDAAREALAPRALCGLVEQACEGLQAIHELGVIHRDISPGNLFVTEAGTLKLLDLGIAKARDTCDRTAPGSIKGKLPYLSPEQVTGRALDSRSDLFSLGLVMYDLARGLKPAHDRIGAYAREHLELAAIEPALAEVIARAVADRDERFASAAEMAQAARAAGAAVGGAYTRSELVEWLAGGFSSALVERRNATARTIACSAATPAATRTLTMRSLLPEDGFVTNGTERLSFDELAPPPRPPRRFVMALPVLGIVVGVVSAVATADDPAAAPLPPPLAQPVVHASPQAPAPEPAPLLPPSAPAPAPAPNVHDVTPRPKPPVASGTLTVDSAPAAWVDVAGYRDETPVYRHPLPAGAYTVQATLPDGRKQVKRVRVRAGRTTTLKLDWAAR
jgi:eukaryotic-like serine/threonine-protein kinase